MPDLATDPRPRTLGFRPCPNCGGRCGVELFDENSPDEALSVYTERSVALALVDGLRIEGREDDQTSRMRAEVNAAFDVMDATIAKEGPFTHAEA